MKKSFLLAVVLYLGVAHAALQAQDIQTKGSLTGTIADVNGAVIQNVEVTITGQKTIDRIVTTNEEGVFEEQNLTPGIYHLNAEKTGFKTTFVSHIEVFVGKVTALKLTLEAGNISEIVDVSDSSAAIDQSSTAVGANLSDQLFHNIRCSVASQAFFISLPAPPIVLEEELPTPLSPAAHHSITCISLTASTSLTLVLVGLVSSRACTARSARVSTPLSSKRHR